MENIRNSIKKFKPAAGLKSAAGWLPVVAVFSVYLWGMSRDPMLAGTAALVILVAFAVSRGSS